MTQLRNMFKRIIIMIILTSILITFVAIPQSYAKLELEEDEFYYSGLTEGEYVVKPSVFAWLLDCIGQIIDFLVGMISMMFRMVFVGWTALFEKLLTKTMESTVGVGVEEPTVANFQESVDGTKVVDQTKWGDPANNITVQSIVFNKVPAFNINFFKDSKEFLYDVTGTGRVLYCQGKECKEDGYPKTCEECCGTATIDSGCPCGCGVGDQKLCSNCERYLINKQKAEEAKDVPLIVIRNAIAAWYYVLRLLSIAAMLLALIAIGIKMAISTIASDKAVYKRMLVDWIVGMIIVFSIHYVMLFIIYINDIFIENIEKATNKIHSAKVLQMAEPLDGNTDGVIKKSNSDLEINIYEMIRTRAYDAKASVGLTGMIMYMTLVYFAIRYSIVYAKRFFTVAILTLIGPPVGVAYALQRTLTGKSVSLKVWFTEYFTNVIIQTIHALIYGVFIGSALILSLESIAGMIVALILMNYALKADKLFRRIFKIGSSGLSQGTAEAGSAENVKGLADRAMNAYLGFQPVKRMMGNTLYAKALKGTARVAVGLPKYAAVSGAAKILNHTEKLANTDTNKEIDKIMIREADNDENNTGNKANESDSEYAARRVQAEQIFNNSRKGKAVKKAKERIKAKEDKEQEIQASLEFVTKTPAELAQLNEGELKKAIKQAELRVSDLKAAGTPEQKAAAERYLNSTKANLEFYKILNPSAGKIVSAHVKDMAKKQSLGETYHINSAGKEGIAKVASGVNAVTQKIWGTSSKSDYQFGKKSNNDSLSSEITLAGILGMSKEDVKDIKNATIDPAKKMLIGDLQMFMGAATCVAHPKLGMGLMASGANKRRSAMRPISGHSTYKGKYSMSRFGTDTMLRVQNTSISGIESIKNKAFQAALEENHGLLVKKLKDDTSKAELIKKARIMSSGKNGFTGVKGSTATGVTFGTLGTVESATGVTLPAIGTVTAGVGLGAALGIGAATGVAGVAAAKFYYGNSGLGQNVVEARRKINKRHKDIIDEIITENAEEQKRKISAEEKVYAEEREKKYEKYTRNMLLNDGIVPVEEITTSIWEEYSKRIESKKLDDPELPRTIVGSTEVVKPVMSSKKLEVTTANGNRHAVKIDEKILKEIDIELDKVVEQMTFEKDTITLSENGKQILETLQDRLVSKGIIGKTERIFSDGIVTEKNIEKTLKRKKIFTEVKEETILEATLERIEGPLGKQMADEAKDKADRTKRASKTGSVVEYLKEKKESLQGRISGLESSEERSKLERTLTSMEGALVTADNMAQLSESITKDVESKEEVTDNFVEKALEKRRKKLSDVLQLADISDEDVASLQSPESSSGILKDLSSYDKDEIVGQLLKRKELEKINLDALDTLQSDKFSKKFKEAKKDESKAHLEYLRAEKDRLENDEPKKYVESEGLEIAEKVIARKPVITLRKGGEGGATVASIDDKGRIDISDEFQIKDTDSDDEAKKKKEVLEKYETFLRQVKKSKDTKLQYERTQIIRKNAGPVIDVNSVVSSIYNNK